MKKRLTHPQADGVRAQMQPHRLARIVRDRRDYMGSWTSLQLAEFHAYSLETHVALAL